MLREVERVMDKVGEKFSIVQQNPIPCALIGLGLGMFVVNRIRNANGRTSRSRAFQHEFEAGMAVPRHAADIAPQHGEYAGSSRQYGASALKQVRKEAMRAGRTFQHFVQENPLAAGAAAVAVGAAVGLALPATRIEDEYLGDASKSLIGSAL